MRSCKLARSHGFERERDGTLQAEFFSAERLLEGLNEDRSICAFSKAYFAVAIQGPALRRPARSCSPTSRARLAVPLAPRRNWLRQPLWCS